MPSVFEKLSDKIREGLAQLDIVKPTPTQEKAFEPIYSGKDVLLVAPTASGKTEAVLLPVFDMLLKQPENEGIQILYITPLRALNRDLERRLKFWSNWLGFNVQIRHGDTSSNLKRLQIKKPPLMLITTPETLQAILILEDMRKHLSKVRWAIIDEIHELACSKRGSQLTVGLERLQRISLKKFQRVGLSATVGNPHEIASFLSRNKAEVLMVDVDKSYKYMLEYPQVIDEDYDLANDFNITPEAASRLRRIISLVKKHRSALIFVQGRGQAESLGYNLRRITPNIEVHHGSLSRKQRHLTEDEFKKGGLKGIVCTSTLQLGIDIGNVDLCIQYLSPRQVSTLIQRVGRAGHSLSKRSEGVLISAYGEDALESLIISEMAMRGEIEKINLHIKPLDVLAHQIVGLALEEEFMPVEDAFKVVVNAFPFSNIEREGFLEVVNFLEDQRLVLLKEDKLMKTKKSKKYYYENLGMINDERRYPFIDLVSDRVIGTVGDEFWTLRARPGLNVIMKGMVWRILRIDDERGVLFALPSNDPLGALPGWDGELIPVSKEVAEKMGDMRERIWKEINSHSSNENAFAAIANSIEVSEEVFKVIGKEIEAHVRAGFPIPTKKRILLEAYDKYLIIHGCFGDKLARTLGCIFDSILSEHDLIYSWWNDPYRILIEAPRALDKTDLENIEKWLFNLENDELEERLLDFIRSRFPFGYRMKFIAERFGAIRKGKTLNPESVKNLYYRFKETPIYKETLREVYQEKIDIESASELMKEISSGEIKIVKVLTKTPSMLAMNILKVHLELSELTIPSPLIENQLDEMKKNIEAKTIQLCCINCGDWSLKTKIRLINEKPSCEKCSSGLLAILNPYIDPIEFLKIVKKYQNDEEISDAMRSLLTYERKTADLVLLYGKKAIIALSVHGIGPITAFKILSKMHKEERSFYSDLLESKIQYMKTRPFWRDEENKMVL